MFDERMLSFFADLAVMHIDPTKSDPALLKEIPDDAEEGEGVRWDKSDLREAEGGEWSGIWKDVGMFTDDEWSFIMCKCLASMGSSSMSSSTRSWA